MNPLFFKTISQKSTVPPKEDLLTPNYTRPKITIATDDLTEEQQVAIREEGLDIQSITGEELDPKNDVENTRKQ